MSVSMCQSDRTLTRPPFLSRPTPADMEAVVWLEDYLSKWKKILFMVSHSQDFLNNVCTHTVHLTNKKLHYYTGCVFV